MSKLDERSAAAVSTGPGGDIADASAPVDAFAVVVVVVVEVDARRECAAREMTEAEAIRPNRHDDLGKRPEECSCCRRVETFLEGAVEIYTTLIA